MLFPQQVFIISHCFALVNTFFKTFFRPPGPNPCFAFSVPPSRDSLDIISHRLAFVNTFFENFFQAARPDRRFLLSCCLSRNSLVIIPQGFLSVNAFFHFSTRAFSFCNSGIIPSTRFEHHAHSIQKTAQTKTVSLANPARDTVLWILIPCLRSVPERTVPPQIFHLPLPSFPG